MFKNLNVHPPGGWRYYQPEIQWPTNPQELRGLGLEAVVDRVLEKRRANPRFGLSLDRDSIRRDILVHTEAIVRRMKGAESYLAPGEPAPVPVSFPSARSFRRKVAEVAGTLKRTTAGVGLLIDWLGDGMEPVDIPIAEKRAAVCATSGPNGSLCPFNRPAHGLQKLSGAVAKDIQELLETRTEMKLGTSHDAVLYTCQICDCNLPLKVLVPMSHLLSKTPEDVLARFKAEWPACWMNGGD